MTALLYLSVKLGKMHFLDYLMRKTLSVGTIFYQFYNASRNASSSDITQIKRFINNSAVHAMISLKFIKMSKILQDCFPMHLSIPWMYGEKRKRKLVRSWFLIVGIIRGTTYFGFRCNNFKGESKREPSDSHADMFGFLGIICLRRLSLETFQITKGLTGMPFYAVRVGRKPGVYNTW